MLHKLVIIRCLVSTFYQTDAVFQATEPGGGKPSIIVSQLMRHLPDMLNMFVNNVAAVAYWGMQVSGENNNR